MTLKSIFRLVALIMVLIACNRNPLDVNIDAVSVDVSYIHLDSILVNSNDRNLCGMYTGSGCDNKFRIHDSLKKKRMKIMRLRWDCCLII